jgi:hypothetical protein
MLRQLLAVVAVVACGCTRPSTTASTLPPVGISTIQRAVVNKEPLSAWVDGNAKQAIVDFVTRVSAPGSPSMLPEGERIAVFDNDGTLWPEQPLPEAAFTVARLRAEIVDKPELAEREPYASVLNGGIEGLVSLGRESVLNAVANTHSGMTDEQFAAEARIFFANTTHPRFGVPYTALVYRPMRELLAYLRDHGFTIYLCTAGDEGFVRAFSGVAYEIPRERVIGSSFRKELVLGKERAVLMRTPELASLNDREEKVLSIARQIGRRPVIAVGRVRNGGDVAMLTYTSMQGAPSLELVINHDDAEREFAYAEPNGETLAAARGRGFAVVSMKNDWVEVFDKPKARDVQPPPPQ